MRAIVGAITCAGQWTEQGSIVVRGTAFGWEGRPTMITSRRCVGSSSGSGVVMMRTSWSPTSLICTNTTRSRARCSWNSPPTRRCRWRRARTGVVYRELLSTHLPEVVFRGKEHRRIQYGFLPRTPCMAVEPDLLDEVTYWIEQYWTYALYAAVAIVRASAASADIPLDLMITDLATKNAIDIA